MTTMVTATLDLADAPTSAASTHNSNPSIHADHFNSQQQHFNQLLQFRSLDSSHISSMSSTSLNESNNSPGSNQLNSASSAERLSLESNRRMLALNNSGQSLSIIPPDDRPTVSSLLHSPNKQPSLNHQHASEPSTPSAFGQMPPQFIQSNQHPHPPGQFHPGLMPPGAPQIQFPGAPPGFPAGAPPHLAHFMQMGAMPSIGRPPMPGQLPVGGLQRPGLLGHHQVGLMGLPGMPGQPSLGNPLGLHPGMGLPHRIPSSDDACASIVHSLMDHRQGGDSEQFTKRAIESLVKKLRERKEELEALIFAVTTGGAQRTRCVTIQRTLDGRLQVAGKKGFPHVIYAKIWRWPDLHKNELRHVTSCQFAFDLKLDSVCVNPYHYERVVSPCPDLMPMNNSEEPSPGQNSYQHPSRYDNRSPNNSASPESPGAQGQSTPPLLPHMQQGNGPPAVPMPGLFSSPYLHHNPPRIGGVVISPQQQQQLAQPKPNLDDQFNANSQNNAPPGAFPSLPPHVMYKPVSNVGFKAKPPPLATPLELWCTINYFELNVQVGQPFKVPFPCRNVIVDGFTDPNGIDRFCLGCLSNVHRDEVVERARPHIGKGVELRHDDVGDVWLKVLSEHSVFLESPYLDSQFGGRQAVHKIYSSAELKVFDLEYCYQQMYEQAQMVHLAKNMLRTTVKGNIPPNARLPPEMANAQNIGVDDYQKHCVLRMSFVKGFGPDYNRKRIEDTPCWIEVKLHWPLKLLDQLLQPLDDPQYNPPSATAQPSCQDESPTAAADLVPPTQPQPGVLIGQPSSSAMFPNQ